MESLEILVVMVDQYGVLWEEIWLDWKGRNWLVEAPSKYYTCRIVSQYKVICYDGYVGKFKNEVLAIKWLV